LSAQVLRRIDWEMKLEKLYERRNPRLFSVGREMEIERDP